jgi:trans-aconitate methyltransferase
MDDKIDVVDRRRWQDWLERWDEQQTGYLPHREDRFTAMLDVLDELLPPDFVAVDLACGPGSLTSRLLTRFPSASCVALDLDPVLLDIGRRALGDAGGRLRWVEADLATAELAEVIGLDRVDAVLCTTALHWLPSHGLTRVYGQLAGLIRPGGVLLNGDNIPFSRDGGVFQKMAENARARAAVQAFGEDMTSGWRQWWEAVAAEPELADLARKREERFAGIGRDHPESLLDFHLAALRDAGFSTVGTLWQRLDDRVVAAVR